MDVTKEPESLALVAKQKSERLQRWSSNIHALSVLVSSIAAVVLCIWGIILYSKWRSKVIGTIECEAPLITSLVLGVSIVDIFSAIIGCVSLFIHYKVEKRLSEYSAEAQAKYSTFTKVDFAIRFITGMFLGIMKNLVAYKLWWSSCKNLDPAFYEQIDAFIIFIIVRVAVSGNAQLISLIFKYLSYRQRKKYESMSYISTDGIMDEIAPKVEQV
ncbi:hypothetical protein AKO1_006273 [Acrasis kona]|uniref:Uncharacterized protein n=1 Tax=Acrasis kona TaxID=1008807 RepID=A0AAW2YHC0_9EUKA